MTQHDPLLTTLPPPCMSFCLLGLYSIILIDKSLSVFDNNDCFLIQLIYLLVVNAKREHVLDVLVDVFSNLRLRGQVYFRTEFVGSWGVALPADHNTIRIHLVVQGQCWVTVDGGNEPILLKEGDFALVPHGAGQILSDTPEVDAVSLETLLINGSLGEDGIFRHGNRDSKQQTRLVCGYCSYDDELDHPLFLGLPPVLVIGPKYHRKFTVVSGGSPCRYDGGKSRRIGWPRSRQ